MEDDKTAGTMMEVGLGCYVRSAFQAIASTPWMRHQATVHSLIPRENIVLVFERILPKFICAGLAVVSFAYL